MTEGEGYAPAEYDLGYLYRHGISVPKHNSKAIARYRKVADQNYASALADLGIMYSKGDILPQRAVPAYAFLKLSMSTEYVTTENAGPALETLTETMTNEQRAAGDHLLDQMKTEGVLIAL